ncbi:MAG: formyl transferase [Candidatus Omnitrophica bacterium]|nr:formyl transferase [Candidatus Omnitrophota bacterium]
MTILILGPRQRNQPLIEFLTQRRHQVQVTTEPVTLEWLREQRIDFMISFGYAPILKPPITTAYRRRIINVHPAYLPEGRGIYTNFWSFLEGRPKGVSLHFIDDEGIDSGDIIVRRLLPLGKDETVRTSHALLDRAVIELFCEVWEQIERGTCQAVSQEECDGIPRYRNRCQSERLMELFPQRWDTPVSTVEAVGAELFLADAFWQRYDRELQTVTSKAASSV